MTAKEALPGIDSLEDLVKQKERKILDMSPLYAHLGRTIDNADRT